MNTNQERLKVLIGFLKADVAPDMKNVEKAAADFLENNFQLVVGVADALDERDEKR